MREILFKAKRIDTGEWVYGDLTRNRRTGNCYIVSAVCGCAHPYNVDAETICQYTGLKDKDGNRIWENDYVAFIDILSTENGYSEYQCAGEVVWDEETVSFQVTDRLSAESYEVLDECAVIGNSFDNPDMLEDY